MLTYEVIESSDFGQQCLRGQRVRDREGNLCWAAAPKGCFVSGTAGLKQLGKREGLIDPLIWSLARDGQGRIVLGSNSNVMRLTDGGIEEIVSTRQIPNLSAYELSYDSHDRLWIGMRSGMAIVDQGKVVTPEALARLSRYQVSVIAKQSDGGAWIGSHDGLFRFDVNKLRKIPSAVGTSSRRCAHPHCSQWNADRRHRSRCAPSRKR